MRRRLFAATVATALLCGACGSPELVTGRGSTVRAAGGSTASPATAAASGSVPASVSPSTAPSASPSPSASGSPGGNPSLALAQRLREVATSPWVRHSDDRSSTSFALPARVEPTTKLQNGVSQRLYTFALTKQSGVSVGYIRLGSPAAAEASLSLYPTQLEQSFRTLGVDDAAVSGKKAIDLDGHPGVAFRFAFTPTTPPQIKPVWLIDIVASGADLVLLQTIVFPSSVRYDYLTPGRQVQRKLLDSLRLPA